MIERDDDALADETFTRGIVAAPSASLELVALVERTRATLEGAIPANTRRAYEGDLRRFVEWCASHRFTPLPAEPATIAVYLRALADRGHRYSTIERALSAICTAHVRADLPSPWKRRHVADMRAGLKVELGVRPKKMRAADDEVLRRMLAALPQDGLLGLRDRAMLTFGWCAALRRSELVALDVADVTRAPKGGVVLVRSSKTDQERRGEEVPVFFSNRSEECPMRSLDAWLNASGITEGAIFRGLGRRGQLGERLSAAAVLDRVRRYAKLVSLPEQPFVEFGAHSLRSGFITTAARRGRDLDAIMVTSRHRSVQVVRGYIRRETLHERGAGDGLL